MSATSLKRKFLSGIFQIFSTSALLATSAISAPRIALVVGNSEYKHVDHLPAAATNAASMKAVLEKAAFEVIFAQNATQAEMSKAIRDFGKKASGAEAAWVFYAGHAVQIGEKNYLIPSDAMVAGESQIKYAAVGLNQVLSPMKAAGTALRVVTLDCSGPNPYAASWGNGITPGMAKITATEGMIVACAAAPGQLTGATNTFASSLVSAIGVKEQDITQTFEKAKTDSSWLDQKFAGSFVVTGSQPIASATAGNLPPPPPAANQLGIPTPTTTSNPTTTTRGVPAKVSATQTLPPPPPTTNQPVMAPALTATTPLTPPATPSIGAPQPINSPPATGTPSTLPPPKRNPALSIGSPKHSPTIPPVQAAPGHPNFTGGKYYRNKEVFKGGPFEKVASITVHGELVKSAQKALLGEDKATGWMNSDTQIAILNLQQKNGFPVTGLIDYQTAGVLKLQLPAMGAGGGITPTSSGASPSNLARGYNVPGQPGMVYSPFSPQKVIDARGRKAGEVFTDPHSNKIFQLPANFVAGSGVPLPAQTNGTTTTSQPPVRKPGMISGKSYNSLNIGGQGSSFLNRSDASRTLKQKRQQELEKLHRDALDR